MEQRAQSLVAAAKQLASDIFQRHQFRLWLIVAGLLGIPTGFWGYNWIMYKWAKQESNCITGFYKNAAKLTDSPSRLEDTLNKTDSEFKDCWSSVDPTKPGYKFVYEEIKRTKNKQ